MKIEILFEDENTLVINKPVGVVVNRAESIKGLTVQDWMERRWRVEGLMNQTPTREIRDDDEKVFFQRSGVCHRLDKETSGCLMIAKNPEALKYYLGLFKQRKIKKTYLALVHGRVEPDEGEVVLPLRRNILNREKWQVHFEGKRAVTEWKVMKRFAYPGHEHWKDALTLLRLNLKTGRTHQIRVHLSFLGWPIFADDKYLNKKFGREDRNYLDHHFLHAASIEFVSFDGVKVIVEAPLPEECEYLLSTLVLE